MKKLSIAAVLAVVVIACISTARAQMPLELPVCSDLGKYRSPGGRPASFVVRNSTNRPLTVSWLDQDAREVALSSIPPGAETEFDASINDFFVVRASGGQCVQVYAFVFDRGTYTVTQAMVDASVPINATLPQLPPPIQLPATALLGQRGFQVRIGSDDDGDLPFGFSTVRRLIFDSPLLEQLAAELNALFKVERQVPVSLKQCGEVNAFYDPRASEITLCDEFIDEIEALFERGGAVEDTRQAATYAFGFTFLHEAGHALVDIFTLPITGREEDVADQFAAYLLAGNPRSAELALAGAQWFMESFRAQPERIQLVWDEHSLDLQRFVNINCWVFGSDPERYAFMVEEGAVPLDRAVRCPGEWSQLRRSFEILLGPHMR